MAPRIKSTKGQEKLPLLQHGPDSHERGKDGLAGTLNKDGAGLTTVRKLLLSAALYGNEACVDFEHLYTMPLLQLLGMPLRLVSLVGVVAGTVTFLLILCLGWLSDRGLNPNLRKTVFMILCYGFLVLGMTCVLVANMLHLQTIGDALANSENSSSVASFEDLPAWNLSSVVKDSGGFVTEEKPGVSEAATYHNASDPNDFITNFAITSSSSEVPFKAGLGFLGFVLLDLSFDCLVSSLKSFLLTVTPRCEHTSLLVLGLVMAAAGGLSTAALGVVDFTSLLGLSYMEGGELAIQTTVQGGFVILVVVLGLAATVFTGQNQRRRMLAESAVSCEIFDKPESEQENTKSSKFLSTVERSLSYMSFSISGMGQPGASVMCSGEDREKTEVAETVLNVTPAISEKRDKPLTDSLGASAMKKSSRNPATVTANKTSTEKIAKVTSPSAPCKSARSLKMNITLVCMSTYFMEAVTFLFSLTSTDFVAKAIYGGEPDAAPGSESLSKYQAGVRAASWGFLVYYGSYVVFSSVNSKVLARIGYKGEVVLVHSLEAICLIALATTSRIEVYYLTAAVAATSRTCFFVVPYAVSNDIMHAEAEKHQGGSPVQTGLIISLVAATLPLAYCTLFPWVGLVMDYTGVVAFPLYLCASCGFLASVIFMFIRIDKHEN